MTNNLLDSELALADVVARLGRDGTAKLAAVVHEVLELLVGVLCRSGGTVLVEGADRAHGSVRAGNVLCSIWLDKEEGGRAQKKGAQTYHHR